MNELARNYVLRESYEEAFMIFSFLSFLDVKNALYRQGIGMTYFFRQQFRKAIPYFNLAHFLNPHLPMPLVSLAECHLILNNREKAIDSYKKAKEVILKNKELTNIYRNQMNGLKKDIKNMKPPVPGAKKKKKKKKMRRELDG